MATTWELVGVCFADAAKAEELVRDAAFQRTLRVDPEEALAAFVLWRRDRSPVPNSATERRARRRSRPVRQGEALAR